MHQLFSKFKKCSNLTHPLKLTRSSGYTIYTIITMSHQKIFTDIFNSNSHYTYKVDFLKIGIRARTLT